ncbi:MAG: hypothetical protein DYG98_13240 [Haliscomenobacteraceae bacterium CHB4]|nr:hypothetical protein [Saprospiraceae bacterium]MCE7924016.1 hypothetical protein [Haliscomenobacteraceae bacterium CHB4]
MQNSKLILLLRTFSSREWKAFRDFVQSPYFNRNREVAALCEWLAGQAPSFEGADRKKAYAALFPGQACDEAHLNHLMSFLLKLCERFIGLEQMNKDELALDFFTLQALADRDQGKHYHYVFQKKQDTLQEQSRRDAQHYLTRYRLENLEANRLSRTTTRKFNEYVQRTADSLDAFYLAEKLRCTCYMLTSQFVIATPYNLQLVDEMCRFLAMHPMPPDTPAIQAYFRIFQLLTKENADDDFEALKTLLKWQETGFGPEEIAELYQYAINYCNLQIMKAREAYVTEALELYIKGIESAILLQDGFLSPWHFKNVIKLGLRLKKYDWTEAFILNNTQLLEPEFREDALHYNLAELYYYTGRYDEAMLHLNKVEFTDVHYNLGAKVILSKIYYETELFDPLESLLHAFKIYLHRNKLISEDLRRTYMNFIGLLWQIVRATPEKYAILHEKVEKSQFLAEKNWLLRQTDFSRSDRGK